MRIELLRQLNMMLQMRREFGDAEESELEFVKVQPEKVKTDLCSLDG